MNLRVVILPAKQLADGTHKIRIALSHRGQTRYIVTRFIVPSTDNLRNGAVVGVSNAAYINQQLRIRMNNIYSLCDNSTDIEYYTCSQLIQYIEEKEKRLAPKTFHEVKEKFLTSKRMTSAPATVRIYEASAELFEKFFGEDYLLQQLTSDDLYRFRQWMSEEMHYSQSSIAMKERGVHIIVNYAVRLKYVNYELSPYVDFTDTPSEIRQCALTLDELRTIRDLDLSDKKDKIARGARDLFMLSFYLCGINLADLLTVDLSGDYISFNRKKTLKRRKNAQKTEFTIQFEAKEIINRIFVNGKMFIAGRERSYRSASDILARGLPKIAEKAGMSGKRLVYYSARKTFAQIANELFVKDSVIEYCIGDSVTQSSKVIGFYIQVNKRMADLSIRKVFDAVATTKSMEQLAEEAVNGK